MTDWWLLGGINSQDPTEPPSFPYLSEDLTYPFLSQTFRIPQSEERMAVSDGTIYDKMINSFVVIIIIIIIIIIIRVMSSVTCTRVAGVMCGDSWVTAGTVIEATKQNWCREENSTWQNTSEWLLIFRGTHTPKLISLSACNESVSHDSCLSVYWNLISIVPRAHSRWDAFLIKVIAINYLLTTFAPLWRDLLTQFISECRETSEDPSTNRRHEEKLPNCFPSIYFVLLPNSRGA